MTTPLGVLQFTEGLDGKALIANAQRLEALGYDILWIPEVMGREPVATCGYLLAKTTRLRVGDGQASCPPKRAPHDAYASRSFPAPRPTVPQGSRRRCDDTPGAGGRIDGKQHSRSCTEDLRA